MYAKYCKLRDERGVTDYQVAKETDINPSTFSDWRNRSCPKLEKLAKISKYFGVPLEYWISEEDSR